MNDNKFPWSLDKPIEEIEQDVKLCLKNGFDMTGRLNYLLDRLKIAEAERDSLREWTAPFKKGWEND